MAGISQLLQKLMHKPLSSDRVGVSFDSDSVSIARVSLAVGDDPELKAAAFVEAKNDEEKHAALKTLVNDHNLKGYDCVAVMPQSECKLVQLEAPDVPEEELKDAVHWKLADLIEYPLEDASYDIFRLPSSNQVGRPDLLYVAVVRKDRVQVYSDIVKSAGLNLKAIDITELVLRNIAALTPEDSNGAAMLYLKENGGMLTMTNGSELFLSRSIDASTATVMHTAQSEPELELGSDTGNPGLDRLVLDLQRSFDYYESYFSKSSVSGLLITPIENGASELNQFLSSHLGTLSRSVDLNSMMSCFGFLSDQLQARCFCAVGAALRKEDVPA